MSWKIYELKESSAKLEQFSVETGWIVLRIQEAMTDEEIEYCLPEWNYWDLSTNLKMMIHE